MPKRVLDFDAMWASDKLASCAGWAQSEYAWLYGLADASGSFEMTNLRVIWGRVAAIRSNLTIERLEQVFDEFIARGLLFTWEESGKRYGHWTGSDVPGRLPPPSWRARLEKLAPPVPQKQLAAYVARFSRGTKPASAALAAEQEGAHAAPIAAQSEAPGGATRVEEADAPFTENVHGSPPYGGEPPLKQGLEPAQAQGLGLDLDTNGEREVKAASVPAAAAVSAQAAPERNGQTQFLFPVEKTAEQPRSSFRSAPTPAIYGRDERAMRVAREINVGAGPVLGPHSAARVKPAALERARRAAVAGRGTPGGASG
jgi:hypothetical protein